MRIAEESNKALSLFARNVIGAARTNLLSKNASRTLTRSLDFEIETGPNSFSLEMFMEDYGKYQDQGVSGTKRKFDTPFSYTTKMPPPSAFDRWGVRRGLAGRDGLGRFANRKSLNFALAMHVFKYGIKPSLFFTGPFKKYFLELPDEFVEAFALDVEKLMSKVLKAPIK